MREDAAAQENLLIDFSAMDAAKANEAMGKYFINNKQSFIKHCDPDLLELGSY